MSPGDSLSCQIVECNKYGISVAVVFQCLEKRDSDAKNNKRTFFAEAAYEEARALVASDVWHLRFADQRSLLPEQISAMTLVGGDFRSRSPSHPALNCLHQRLQSPVGESSQLE